MPPELELRHFKRSHPQHSVTLALAKILHVEPEALAGGTQLSPCSGKHPTSHLRVEERGLWTPMATGETEEQHFKGYLSNTGWSPTPKESSSFEEVPNKAKCVASSWGRGTSWECFHGLRQEWPLHGTCFFPQVLRKIIPSH